MVEAWQRTVQASRYEIGKGLPDPETEHEVDIDSLSTPFIRDMEQRCPQSNHPTNTTVATSR